MKITESKLLYRVSKISLRSLFASLLAVIFGFALLYFLMNHENGLKSTVHNKINFGDCIYYSIVTITTLGSGDYFPVGWSKCLSSIEVLFGASFFGMMVAKITAAKSDYILHRLYSCEVQKRLLEFDTGINQFSDILKTNTQSKDLLQIFAVNQLSLPGN